MGATPEWLERAADGSERHRAWCERALSTYFAVPLPARPDFSGAFFDTLGENPPNTVTTDDLVAVSLLSVRVPKHAALRLLGPGADEIAHLLQSIPTDIDLHRAERRHIEDGGDADRLWTLVARHSSDRRRADVDGLGPVTTSKLLARKRPRLLPAWDSAVGRQLGLSRPRRHWTCLHDLLHGDARFAAVLESAHRSADVSPRVSVLRTLDVLLWMDGTGHCPAP